jgi:glycolate oxidase
VRPRTVEEVSRLLQWANANGTPVTTRGGGYGYVGGAVTNRGGVLLSLDRMNTIREISTADFVAEVEAGVVTGDLQQAARAQGLFIRPTRRRWPFPLSAATSRPMPGGPRCLKYGVTRHYVLGLEVVLADGTILNLGGRTHKNKTGFDLLGLMVGSEGMLGVVTAATLRLLPHPPFRAGLAAIFPDIESAASGVGAIFAAGLLPAAVEVADRFTLQCFREAQGLEPDEAAGAHLLVECDGQEPGVHAELEAVAKALRTAGATRFEMAPTEAAVEKLWEVRRGFSMSLNAPNRAKLNEDIVVPRGRLVDLVTFGSNWRQNMAFESRASATRETATST